MLTQNLNAKLEFGSELDREDVEQLVKDNRTLRVHTTQLTEKNTELTLKIQAVDHLYRELKSQLLASKEEANRLRIEKEALQGELQSRYASAKSSRSPSVKQSDLYTQEDCLDLNKVALELHYLLSRNKAPKTMDNISPHSLSKLKDKNQLCEWLSKQVRQLQELLDFTNERIGELENSEKRNQSIIRGMKAKLEDLGGFDREIEKVREELNQVYQEKAELNAENNVLRQQFEEASRKAEHFERVRMTTPNRQSKVEEQDEASDGFAVELLMLEKSKLYNLIQRLIQANCSKESSNLMLEIFELQIAELELHRGRLELEYELQELECNYRRMCKMGQPDQRLIELRKRIQLYREQLACTNAEVSSAGLRIDSKIEEYTVLNLNQEKRRAYSLDIEKKLVKTKHDFDQYKTSADGLKQNWETKLNFDQNFSKEEKPSNQFKPKPSPKQSSFIKNDRICFYQSNQAEAIVHEAVSKDRQNLENLFQQTRNRLYRMKSAEMQD